jgi:hypothetical protein
MVTLPPGILEAPELVLYVLQLKSGSGSVLSLSVKGFEIPIRAIFDAKENLNALRQILAGQDTSNK